MRTERPWLYWTLRFILLLGVGVMFTGLGSDTLRYLVTGLVLVTVSGGMLVYLGRALTSERQLRR